MTQIKRGISYYGNRIPWRVREDLEAMKDAGCTYVVHTFSEQDLEFYEGAMREIVDITHELGMEVWLDPWAVGLAFGGESYSKLIAEDLSVRQVSAAGESLPIACPNQPGFRNYLLKWIDVAASMGPEVLFWDEPHFYISDKDHVQEKASWGCRCNACQALFLELYGMAMPTEQTEDVLAFKEQSIVSFTEFLCDATKAKDLQAAVCVLPFQSSSTVNNWEKIAQIKNVDIFGTDPYWQPGRPDVGAYVGQTAQRVMDLATQYEKEAQLWILNFNIPKGEEPKITEAIEAAEAAGIRNFAAWSYYGAAYMSLRAGDPKKVWNTLAENYHRLAAQ